MLEAYSFCWVTQMSNIYVLSTSVGSCWSARMRRAVLGITEPRDPSSPEVKDPGGLLQFTGLQILAHPEGYWPRRKGVKAHIFRGAQTVIFSHLRFPTEAGDSPQQQYLPSNCQSAIIWPRCQEWICAVVLFLLSWTYSVNMVKLGGLWSYYFNLLITPLARDPSLPLPSPASSNSNFFKLKSSSDFLLYEICFSL